MIISFCVFQEIDSKEAEEERKRSSQANKKTSNRGISAANKPPQPRKYTKKAKNVEPENDNSSMEIGKPKFNIVTIPFTIVM